MKKKTAPALLLGLIIAAYSLTLAFCDFAAGKIIADAVETTQGH